MVLSTEEAAPVGDIEASKKTRVSTYEHSNKMEKSAPSKDVKKEETNVAGNDETENAESSASMPSPANEDDIEVGIPTDEEQDKAPESPFREKDITVEHGVPPETPARDYAKSNDIDPNSPSHETEADESFASAESLNGDAAISKKSKRRCSHLIFGTIILVLIVGAVLGIVFGTGVPVKKSEPATVNSSQGGAQGDTTAPDVPANDSGADGDAPAPESGEDSPAPSAAEGDNTQPDDPVMMDDPLLEILKGFTSSGLDDINSPQFKAYQWMADEDPLSDANTEPARLQQRYSLATLFASLMGEIPSYATLDECTWPSVACGTHNATNLFGTEPWQVTEINMARLSLNGTIPTEIGLLAPSIVSIDLAENPDLTGSIPEEVYTCLNLMYLYLHDNAMTGTLSESIANLQLLDSLFLGNNQFTGTIPYNLGSRLATRRPMRKWACVCV